jgi:hypothetical protein
MALSPGAVAIGSRCHRPYYNVTRWTYCNDARRAEYALSRVKVSICITDAKFRLGIRGSLFSKSGESVSE